MVVTGLKLKDVLGDLYRDAVPVGSRVSQALGNEQGWSSVHEQVCLSLVGPTTFGRQPKGREDALRLKKSHIGVCGTYAKES